MKKRFLNPFTPICLLTIFLLIFYIFKNIIFIPDYSHSLLHNPIIISTIVYTLCAILALLCIFKQKLFFIYYVGLEFLIAVNILNGNDLIALVLLMYFFIIFSLVAHPKKQINILVFVIVIQLNTSLTCFLGIKVAARFLCLSIVFALLLSILSNLVKDLYQVQAFTQKELINLSDFNFTERQLFCIKEIFTNHSTVTQIADQINVSPSVIKKELMFIYKTLNVKDKTELSNFLSTNHIVIE